MSAKHSENMQSSKMQQSGEPSQSRQEATTDLLTSQEACLKKLRAIQMRAQELLSRASADVARAQVETQISVQMRQQALALDHRDKVHRIGPTSCNQMAEQSHQHSEDLRLTTEEARKSLVQTFEQATTKFNTDISDINHEWEQACLDFVGSLRQRINKVELSNSASQLAQIGHSLVWIAAIMRKPTEV